MKKKKDKNLIYILLGLGVVGGLYFLSKKEDKTTTNIEKKPTSDLGNDKNDKPEVETVLDDIVVSKPLDTGVVSQTNDVIDFGVVSPLVQSNV